MHSLQLSWPQEVNFIILEGIFSSLQHIAHVMVSDMFFAWLVLSAGIIEFLVVSGIVQIQIDLECFFVLSFVANEKC